MKRIFILLAFLWIFFIIAANANTNCAQAIPDDQPGFCSSFKSSAECHCVDAGLPKIMCQDMNSLYSRMIILFGSLEKICQYQHETSTQICIDAWNCYRLGGKDSQGRSCSSTGIACQ